MMQRQHFVLHRKPDAAKNKILLIFKQFRPSNSIFVDTTQLITSVKVLVYNLIHLESFSFDELPRLHLQSQSRETEAATTCYYCF